MGAFKNGGREYAPAGSSEQVNAPDFPDADLGKAVPYGIYDVSANTGWVSVGTDHDTSALAIARRRRHGRCPAVPRRPVADPPPRR